MTRDELAREVALRTGVTRREAQAVIESALVVIEERLCAGEQVFLRGFGCFEAKPAGGRRARDPRGDGVLEIPPRVKPAFRPYDRLRESVHAARSPSARAVFFFDGDRSARAVSLVGSFNGWDATACPMQRLPDGSWVAEAILPAGSTISYRFCVDGRLVRDPDPRVGQDGRGNSSRSV